MNNPFPPSGFRLRDLPVSGRLMLTCFLAIIGAGYLAAVANVYVYHHNADGEEKFSFNDLKAVYSGIDVEVKEGKPLPSRMQEMIQGEMREFLEEEEEFDTLIRWLAAGAKEEDFEKQLPNLKPSEIISDRCLRCHAPDGDKKQEKARKTPFGPDIFTVDFKMVSNYTQTRVDAQAGTARREAQSIPRLILTSHIHMLSIPMFTLVTSLLVMMTGLRPVIRGPLVALPMLTLLVDFAGWWLARWAPGAIWLIAASAPLYGLALAGQLLSTFGSMWFGRRGDRVL